MPRVANKTKSCVTLGCFREGGGGVCEEERHREEILKADKSITSKGKQTRPLVTQ